MTDKEIVDLMLSSTTIQEWNSNRESIKKIRDNNWIGINIDAAELINKSNLPKYERK